MARSISKTGVCSSSPVDDSLHVKVVMRVAMSICEQPNVKSWIRSSKSKYASLLPSVNFPLYSRFIGCEYCDFVTD